MTPSADNPIDVLEKLFHEPNRLSLLSSLCAADGGLPFTELKAACRLTDGNLNRHLKVLEESGVVRIEKKFVQSRPRTTIYLTRMGLKRFQEYLNALTAVLEQARQAAGAESAKPARAALGKAAPA